MNAECHCWYFFAEHVKNLDVHCTSNDLNAVKILTLRDRMSVWVFYISGSRSDLDKKMNQVTVGLGDSRTDVVF